MANPIGDIVEGVVDAVSNPGVDDLVADALTPRKRPGMTTLLLVLMLIGLAVGVPLLLQHAWNAERHRLTLITFDTSDEDAWSASVAIDRQAAEYANAWNTGESISGPYPSMAVFEGDVRYTPLPRRALSYRIIEAIGPVPARFHSIPDASPASGGLLDRLTGIPADRVDRYLPAAADALDRAGHSEIARATRGRLTEITSLDHGVLKSTFGVAGSACIGLSAVCFVLLIGGWFVNRLRSL